MAAPNLLKVNTLTCERDRQPLFAPLSFELSAGKLLLIEGPNGSGKSSLLRLLTGLATPRSGTITWGKQEIQRLGTDYRQVVHYLSHQNGLKLNLTVKENIYLAHYFTANITISAAAVDAALTDLKLDKQIHSAVKFLSAGQKRRIALARLLLIKKPLWILDEPFTALDTPTQTWFLALLEKHLDQGGIAIITSHQPIAVKAANTQTIRLAT